MTRYKRRRSDKPHDPNGFFVFASDELPAEVFHLIMSFVPAYPYYFTLRAVCQQWNNEIINVINVKKIAKCSRVGFGDDA